MRHRANLLIAVSSLLVFCLSASLAAEETADSSSGYDDLVQLFESWREFQQPYLYRRTLSMHPRHYLMSEALLG